MRARASGRRTLVAVEPDIPERQNSLQVYDGQCLESIAFSLAIAHRSGTSLHGALFAIAKKHPSEGDPSLCLQPPNCHARHEYA